MIARLLSAPRAYPAGTHHPDGILVAAGPGIARNAERKLVQLIDVPSILLYSLGLPVPEDFEGTVPSQLFTEAHVDATSPAEGSGCPQHRLTRIVPRRDRRRPSGRRSWIRCAPSDTLTPDGLHRSAIRAHRAGPTAANRHRTASRRRHDPRTRRQLRLLVRQCRAMVPPLRARDAVRSAWPRRKRNAGPEATRRVTSPACWGRCWITCTSTVHILWRTVLAVWSPFRSRRRSPSGSKAWYWPTCACGQSNRPQTRRRLIGWPGSVMPD